MVGIVLVCELAVFHNEVLNHHPHIPRETLVMHKLITTAAALLACAHVARAGDVIVQATGTVFSANITSTTSPFVGVTAGQPVHLTFEVFVPGTPQSVGLELYTVDAPTLAIQVGAASASATGGTPTILMQNGNPGGTDGLRFLSVPVTGGSGLGFDFGALDNLFSSTDITQNLGTWSPTLWSAYDWHIQGGGVNIDITPVTISISTHAVGTAYCFGDGSGTACPCGNASSVGDQAGCLSSLGMGGKIIANGVASLSGDTIVLAGTQMSNSSALYFQGTTQSSAGAGAIFGDGLRCAGGSIVRLRSVVNVAGASQYPAAGDPSVSVRGAVSAPGTRTYQIWYRNAAPFCTPSTFNLTNGLEIVWGS